MPRYIGYEFTGTANSTVVTPALNGGVTDRKYNSGVWTINGTDESSVYGRRREGNWLTTTRDGAEGKLINITSAPPAVSTPYVVNFEAVSEYNMTANSAGPSNVPGVWEFTVIGGSFNTNLEGVGGGGFGGAGSLLGVPVEAGYPGAATTFVGPGLSMTAGGGTGAPGISGSSGYTGDGGTATGGDTNTPGNPASGGYQGFGNSPGGPGGGGATVAPAYFTPLGQNGAGQGGPGGPLGSDPQPSGGGGGGGSGAYVSKNETLIAGGTYTFTVGAEGNKPYPTPAVRKPGGVKITAI